MLALTKVRRDARRSPSGKMEEGQKIPAAFLKFKQ
jgi:hypothetical protein